MDPDSSQKISEEVDTQTEIAQDSSPKYTSDGSENMEPPDSMSVKSITELSKELTGNDFDEDPEEVVYTMMQDRKKIAAKYGLPLLNPEDIKEKYKSLEEIAMRNNTPISYVNALSLQDANLRGGVTSEGKIVIAKIDLENSTTVEIYNRAVDLEHELLHVLQHLDKSHEMPIEEMEYEAYVLTYLPTVVNTYSSYPEGYIRFYMIASEMFEHIRNSSIGYKKAVRDKSQRVKV